MTKIGRNDPCPCGSGKKYKRCCGSGSQPDMIVERVPVAEDIAVLSHLPDEQVLTGLERNLSDLDPASIAEAAARLETALLGRAPGWKPASPIEEAQDLMYDAWEEPSQWQRVRLAKEALGISPDCADAYVLLAEEATGTLEARRDFYAQGVAAGERALGKRAFRKNVGHFWSMIETRPYMRARFGLAQCLWELGDRQAAIEHYEDMLRLNPGDNQGVRYVLLAALLTVGARERTADLLARYEDDFAAAWAYGRALHSFQIEGDGPAARKLLAEAKRINHHVPPYLSGRKPLPAILPDLMGIGDEAEGIICGNEQLEAWRTTPNAQAWLRKHT